jgi:serine/threonine protein kinase
LFDFLVAQDCKLEASQAQKFFRELVSAVEHLHVNNVVHRDIKLENIFLDEHFSVRLGDFGLAQEISTKLLNVCGSLDFIAPEMTERQSEHYDGKAADIYAMGICLFMLLTGAPLYQID